MANPEGFLEEEVGSELGLVERLGTQAAEKELWGGQKRIGCKDRVIVMINSTFRASEGLQKFCGSMFSCESHFRPLNWIRPFLPPFLAESSGKVSGFAGVSELRQGRQSAGLRLLPPGTPSTGTCLGNGGAGKLVSTGRWHESQNGGSHPGSSLRLDLGRPCL